MQTRKEISLENRLFQAHRCQARRFAKINKTSNKRKFERTNREARCAADLACDLALADRLFYQLSPKIMKERGHTIGVASFLGRSACDKQTNAPTLLGWHNMPLLPPTLEQCWYSASS